MLLYSAFLIYANIIPNHKQWAGELGDDDSDDDEGGNGGLSAYREGGGESAADRKKRRGNYCDLVWVGKVAKRGFTSFKFQEVSFIRRWKKEEKK